VRGRAPGPLGPTPNPAVFVAGLFSVYPETTWVVVGENPSKNENRRSRISMFMTVHRLCGRRCVW